MRKSTNYELNLLDEDDFYSEELLNANAEKIDEVLKSLDNPDYDVEEQSDVEELEPGESLTISIRKLAKAVKDYISHKSDTKNPHKVTKSQVGLSDVPNVTTNNQTPTYTVASSVTELTSGETLSTACGKLAKAVADYISHKADVVAHITAEERNAWNAKLGADKIAANLTTTTEGMVLAAAMGKTLKEQIDKNATDISTLNSNLSKKLNWKSIKNIAPQSDGIFHFQFYNNFIGVIGGISRCLLIINSEDNTDELCVGVLRFSHGNYYEFTPILSSKLQWYASGQKYGNLYFYRDDATTDYTYSATVIILN